jgi:Helix-turn-helix domain
VSENLKKGTRVTGTDRSKLATTLGKRYQAGESIRSLAASTGRSYGFVHRILVETGVLLRGRSGATRTAVRSRRDAASDTAQPQIPVQIFLEEAAPGPAVEEAVREVLLMSGVEDVREEQLIIRSWYRALTGLLKRAADSDAAAEARRAVELQVLDRFQAGIDGITGDAVAKLITALNQTNGAGQG